MKSCLWRYILLNAVCILISFCCQKKKEGCKDGWANNYCVTCNADNGECEYTGSGVFWYQSYVADSLETAGSTSLTYFIDGHQEGTTPIYHGYWLPDPLFGTTVACGDTNAYTVTKTWKGTKTHHFNYIVKNQNGTQLSAGQVTFDVQSCAHTELTF